MSMKLRLTEKWMQRGLWVVAILFAAFLNGLGGKLVANMWDVEPALTVDQFIDPVQGPAVRAAARLAERKRDEAIERLDQAREKHKVAQSNARLAEESFRNWIDTRRATANPSQDQELVARTRALDDIKAAERAALSAVETQQQAQLDAEQARTRAAEAWDKLEQPALKAVERAFHMRELRVFLYRLALTLPLLIGAAWLFKHKRASMYWPFVWGFIFFAGFAFFVELVPYLPSYGGYVRNIVGIVMTVVIGRYAILALQRYLARQKEAEALPDTQRRAAMRYDTAFTRLSKSVCPGCERRVDLKDTSFDFCPHCGICLFDHCGRCNARKGAFARFCFSCGTPAKAGLPE